MTTPERADPRRAQAMYLSPRVRAAARVIRAGGVVAYPTEGVYGLGCRPDDPAAVARIFAIKGRQPEAGLILIAGDPDQLTGWIVPSAPTREALSAHTPGPVTWVVAAAAGVPAWITGGRDTIAVRVTRHPLASALCLASGVPLVSTSANRTGRPPARTALAVRCRFRGEVDHVLGGATGGATGPSEIRDARTGAVLRPASRANIP